MTITTMISISENASMDLWRTFCCIFPSRSWLPDSSRFMMIAAFAEQNIQRKECWQAKLYYQ
jgi:hypothetical protein